MPSQAQTEVNALKQRSNTTPVTPTSSQKKEKGLGFFKRHLGHRRRSSSVSFPNNASPTQDKNQNQNQNQDKNQPLKNMIRKVPIASTTNNESDERDTRNGSVVSGDYAVNSPPQSPPQSPPPGSKAGGVKWAAGYVDAPSTRTRRASSAGTAGTVGTRRGSIYVRGAEGGYIEGVDAGVGSKARRLSVQIPDRLIVDECSLSDHFSVFARAGKKEIGEGGAAVVRLMQSKTVAAGKGKVFAVKEFREWDSEEEEEWDYIRKIKSEYAISKSCQHPNIVETHCLCFADKKWFHVMEYCDLGDLNDIIAKGYFSRDDRNCMFKQLLRGVEYLHTRGIAHRDLKSENLLLTSEGCLKIADFGTAEVFCGTHPGLKGCRRQSIIGEDAEVRLCKPGLVGSRPYMAPEIIGHQADYDPRGVDVWSCAIVYLTLCLGGTPWDCASPEIKNYNIYCSTWDEWLEKYPDGIIKEGRSLPKFAQTRQFQMLDDLETKLLLMGMLHPDPAKRWSAHDALETKVVTEYPCCQQQGYSDDIRTRQRKVLHNHCPPKERQKGHRFLK